MECQLKGNLEADAPAAQRASRMSKQCKSVQRYGLAPALWTTALHDGGPALEMSRPSKRFWSNELSGVGRVPEPTCLCDLAVLTATTFIFDVVPRVTATRRFTLRSVACNTQVNKEPKNASPNGSSPMTGGEIQESVYLMQNARIKPIRETTSTSVNS